MICETLTYLNLTYYLAYLLYVFETQTTSLAKAVVKETSILQSPILLDIYSLLYVYNK